jgi:glutamate-1-semialdehyde 2,1-aminomutase
MSLLTSPMDDIWNSAYMRNVRRAMLNGERISACEVCYESEAASGESYRTTTGAEPVEGLETTPEALMAYGTRTGFRVDQWPRFIKLEIGNLCNLKCRMCYGGTSSQIERDPVHSRWAGGADPLHAIWRGTVARIGPEPRIGVRSTGLYPPEDIGEAVRRWTDGHAVFNIPVKPDTQLEALEIEFHDDGLFDQSYQVIVNGRRLTSGTVDKAQRNLSLDLSKLNHNGRLIIEIPSSKFVDRPGQPERGVPLRRIDLRRRDENVVSHPQILARTTAVDGPWYAHDDKLFGELLRSSDTLSRLYITGGEPFINDRIKEVFDHLITGGAAAHINLELSTNCTHVDAPLVTKLKQFKRLSLWLSIDAIGGDFEYIRYPARWSIVDKNVRFLRQTHGLHCAILPVIQIYNVMRITEVFRYCDELSIHFGMNILQQPPRLSIRHLPPSARALAAARLMNYHDKECHAERRPLVKSLATYLAGIDTPTDHKALRDFMLFTNDLDATRGQSFRTAHAELVELMAEDGFEWTDETVYAHGDVRHKPARDRAFAWV